MLYNHKSFVILFVISLLAACTNRGTNSSTTQDESMESILTQEFEDFYYKFHSDSLYQLDHISFPLEGKTYNEDNEIIMKKWEKNTWTLHKPFDDLGGTFQRQYSAFGEIVTEVITDQNNISSMERRFAKVQGQWHLIYYDPIHLHE